MVAESLASELNAFILSTHQLGNPGMGLSFLRETGLMVITQGCCRDRDNPSNMAPGR